MEVIFPYGLDLPPTAL